MKTALRDLARRVPSGASALIIDRARSMQKPGVNPRTAAELSVGGPLQVLQEYFVTATRKLRLDAAVARRKVELLAELDVAIPDVADVLAAIDLHRLHGFSFWDALVLRAAKQSGCTVLLSEDLQGGRELDGVRIVNPFAERSR